MKGIAPCEKNWDCISGPRTCLLGCLQLSLGFTSAAYDESQKEKALPKERLFRLKQRFSLDDRALDQANNNLVSCDPALRISDFEFENEVTN